MCFQQPVFSCYGLSGISSFSFRYMAKRFCWTKKCDENEKKMTKNVERLERMPIFAPT